MPDTAPAPGQIDVYGDPSCYIAVHAETKKTVATFYPDEDEGWWRINTSRGVLGMWVPPKNPEPWREIVERLLRR